MFGYVFAAAEAGVVHDISRKLQVASYMRWGGSERQQLGGVD